MPSNEIHTFPRLDKCYQLRLLDLSYNKISSLEINHLRHQSQLTDLLLRNNLVESISRDTFRGLSNLLVLDMQYNRIKEIHADAFRPLTGLQRLNLNGNEFRRMPTAGLDTLAYLHCANNAHLTTFPSTAAHFPSLVYAELSYAYHCCEAPQTLTAVPESAGFQESVIVAPANHSSSIQHLLERFVADNYTANPNENNYKPDLLHLNIENSQRKTRHKFVCEPTPSIFMPCDDLFSWWLLRLGVWLVAIFCVAANTLVLVVLVSAHSSLDVPQFLLSHLALADLCMGLYLSILVGVDITTLGQFRKHAIQWQMSPGCQIAGFLSIFSCELSVSVLTIITLERAHAMTHVMDLNRRMSRATARTLLLVGWIFALLMAASPLYGISDYRRYAVCLPFRLSRGGALYITCLVTLNGAACCTLAVCYARIYASLRDSAVRAEHERRIALRMLVLVTTNFLCWGPVALVALMASVFHVHIIGLTGAKILVVFVLPLNSCLNPLLYAILTRRFQGYAAQLWGTVCWVRMPGHTSRRRNCHVEMNHRCVGRSNE